MCIWKEFSVSMSFWMNPEWNEWGNEESRKLYLLILDSSAKPQNDEHDV